MSFDIAKRISYLTTLIEQKRSDLPDFPEKFRMLKTYPGFFGFFRISEKMPDFDICIPDFRVTHLITLVTL
jgi:hypothetical protein